MLAPSSTLIPHCSSHLCWDRDLSLTPALSLPPCWKSSLRDKKGAHFKEHPIPTSPHAPASDKRNGERKHEHDETKPRASEEVDTASYLPLTGPSELRPARVRACAPHPARTATPLTSSVPFLHKASQPMSTHDSCSRQGLYYDFTVHLFISPLLPDVKLLEDWKQFLDAVKCTGLGTETGANAWLSPVVVLRPWVSRCVQAWLPHLSIGQQSSLPGGKMKWDNRCKRSGHLVISWTSDSLPSFPIPSLSCHKCSIHVCWLSDRSWIPLHSSLHLICISQSWPLGLCHRRVWMYTSTATRNWN